MIGTYRSVAASPSDTSKGIPLVNVCRQSLRQGRFSTEMHSISMAHKTAIFDAPRLYIKLVISTFIDESEIVEAWLTRIDEEWYGLTEVPVGPRKSEKYSDIVLVGEYRSLLRKR